MAVSVTSILRRKGFTMPLRKREQSAYNVAEGGYVASGLQTFEFTGVFINYNQEEIDATTVLSTDKKLLIDADSLSTIPAVGDIVQGTVVQDQVQGGFKIESIREIAPNGSVVAYTCQVR